MKPERRKEYLEKIDKLKVILEYHSSMEYERHIALSGGFANSLPYGIDEEYERIMSIKEGIGKDIADAPKYSALINEKPNRKSPISAEAISDIGAIAKKYNFPELYLSTKEWSVSITVNPEITDTSK